LANQATSSAVTTPAMATELVTSIDSNFFIAVSLAAHELGPD
jgi:hypothetical protein